MQKENFPSPSAPPQAVAYVVDPSHVYVTPYNDNVQQIEESKTKDFDGVEFRNFVDEYEISTTYAIKLRQLEGYDIVFICDDSGSMKAPVTTPNTKNYENLPTRWTEMQNIVKIVTRLSIILDDDGIDVYPLNRPPMFNVTSETQLNELFKNPPSGGTPTLRVLKQVLKDKEKALKEKKLLIIIATDGEPNDETNDPIGNLFNFLKNQRRPAHKIHTTVLACTDDNKTMEYLENWDHELENFDVVDDYYSERERIQENKGKSYKFSFGDYIVKILLGSIDKELDNLDGSANSDKNKQNSVQQPAIRQPVQQTYGNRHRDDKCNRCVVS
jgi:hypothetical protein